MSLLPWRQIIEPAAGIAHTTLTILFSLVGLPSVSLWIGLVYMCTTLAVFVLPKRNWVYAVHHVVSAVGSIWTLFVSDVFLDAVRVLFFLEISSALRNAGMIARIFDWQRASERLFVLYLFAFVCLRPFLLFKVSQLFYAVPRATSVDVATFDVFLVMYVAMAAMHIYWGVQVTHRLVAMFEQDQNEK